MRALAATTAFVLAFGVGTAVAGTPNDDDNDYEGRIGGSEETYFGFDLSENGNRVNGITAHVHYKCGNEEGDLLVETDGGLRVDSDGRFSGKTTGESKVSVTYITSGKLVGDGRARGTLEAKGKFNGDTKCRVPNDGDWNAKEGRDIDAPFT